MVYNRIMARKDIRGKIASYLFSWFYDDAPSILEEPGAYAQWDSQRSDAFVITVGERRFRVVVSELRK